MRHRIRIRPRIRTMFSRLGQGVPMPNHTAIFGTSSFQKARNIGLIIGNSHDQAILNH